jgi:hypothetical protein
MKTAKAGAAWHSPRRVGFLVITVMRPPFKLHFCGIMGKIIMARPGEMSPAARRAGPWPSETLPTHISVSPGRWGLIREMA